MEIGPVLDFPNEELEELYAPYAELDLNQCVSRYIDILNRLQKEFSSAPEKNKQEIFQLTQIEEYLKNRIAEKAIIRYFEENEDEFPVEK